MGEVLTMRRTAFRVNGEKTVSILRISKQRLVVVISSDSTKDEQPAKGDVEAFLARLIRWAEAEK